MSIQTQAEVAARALRLNEDEITIENVARLRNSRGHWDDIGGVGAAEIIELIRLCRGKQ